MQPVGSNSTVLQDHAIELGKLGLDCLIFSEVDLGHVCHCIAATLATMAAHERCAGFIMEAPGDSVVKTVLELVEVEDEGGFTSAGVHAKAA